MELYLCSPCVFTECTENFFLSISAWLRITSGMRCRVAGRAVPDVSKERDSSIFILDPSKLEDEGSMCLCKDTSRCPTSIQPHVLLKLNSRFITCLCVIKTCCDLTRRNGNLVWFCIYFKTKLPAVFKVLYCRLAPSCGISHTNPPGVLKTFLYS